MIGTLLYAALGTRPDISYAVTRLSRYNQNPLAEHINYAKYALKYLVSTKDLRICYDGSSNAGLIGYSDSDWAEDRDDHHATSGHVFTMANAAISWVSRRQKTVALSVGEAEYMELSDASRQNAWLQTFLTEIGFEPTDATPLCGNNQSSIFFAVNHIVER